MTGAAGRFQCVACGGRFVWRKGWWEHVHGGHGHEVVPPPRPLLPEPLARALAVLTGEAAEAWRGRSLLWPDTPSQAGRATLHGRHSVRWRRDEPPAERGGAWVHEDSSSALRTADPVRAWALLAEAGLVTGDPPDGLDAVRNVLRCAAGVGPGGSCQPDGDVGGVLVSGTEAPWL